MKQVAKPFIQAFTYITILLFWKAFAISGKLIEIQRLILLTEMEKVYKKKVEEERRIWRHVIKGIMKNRWVYARMLGTCAKNRKKEKKMILLFKK